MLTFTPSDTSEVITVQVNGDTANEAICETFFVSLSSPVNATISDGTGQGGITDDDGTKLVISQVYGGGGNASATYTNDFIEIFNRGNAPVSLNGMSVQYVGATTTTGSWSKTDLPNVTLQPGQYFLVQEASGGANGSPLPTADATGTIPMAAGAGRVALVNSSTALSATACPSGAQILDLVGYGSTAICREGASTSNNAPGPSNNTNSVQRAQGGCQDLNLNGPSGTGDFSLAAPNPRNTSTAVNTCSCNTSYSSFFRFGDDWLKGSLAQLTVRERAFHSRP
jgi:predicted extracellular nuclease